MSDEGTPLRADQTFKRVVWRHTVSLSHTMEQATTWSILVSQRLSVFS